MVDYDSLNMGQNSKVGISASTVLNQTSSSVGQLDQPQGGRGAGVPIFILGKKYYVPEGCTIQKAFEFAGYRLTRGCGCRGGFCGACATVYRIANDHHLKVGLACQTVVSPDMHLTTIPFFPAQKALYDLNQISDPVLTAIDLYPELIRCYGCATCSKACPQQLDVIGYVAAILRGDLQRAADLSFECVMCGLCAARCPAEIVPYNAALFARRAYAKLVTSKSKPLEARVADIKAGKYDLEIADLMNLGPEDLKELHGAQDMEIP